MNTNSQIEERRKRASDSKGEELDAKRRNAFNKYMKCIGDWQDAPAGTNEKINKENAYNAAKREYEEARALDEEYFLNGT